VPGIFDRLAQAAGEADPTTVMQAVGGTDYQYHATDPAALAAIVSQPWTHVVLQNYSTEPTHLADGSHSVADHLTYGAELCRQVLTNHPQAQVILFETWSRAASHPLITGVSSPSGFASTDEFQAELRTNYARLASLVTSNHPASPPVRVGPVGDAWQNAGGLRAASDPLFADLHGADDYHGNDNGYYLAAAVFYSVIYGRSPEGLSTHPLVTGLNLGLTEPPAMLERVAWATVSGQGGGGPTSSTWLVDFGSAATPTVVGAAPDDPARSWNNVGAELGAVPGARLEGLMTVDGRATAVGLEIVRRFNGANTAGTTASARYPANATRDSLFGNTTVFNGLSNVLPAFKLTGLATGQVYQLSFYASRTGSTDNRETRYTVEGATVAATELNAANNVDGVSPPVEGMAPNAAGEILVSLAPGPNNNNANLFTYLGVLRLEASPRPEPVVILSQPKSVTVSEGQPATFAVTVSGTPPLTASWRSNGVAIPGADQLAYVLPAAASALSGVTFSVAVSNAVGGVISDGAVLTVRPSVDPGTEPVLIDFGGGSVTGLGPAPNDPESAWNNVTGTMGANPAGRLDGLVSASGRVTGLGLAMRSRFNGANENGTTVAAPFPQNATRDSLYGNTEVFSGLTNIFPAFELNGLDSAFGYDLTFYASRTGVSDNRETGYTVEGAATNLTVLNAANNVTNVARLEGVRPDASGRLVIRLAPTARNNNANHFTYLGVLRVDPRPPVLMFRSPAMRAGRLELDWSGTGRLEWAPNPSGPWTAVDPSPAPPWSEPLQGLGPQRFYRLVRP
jgi:hypothetical protein